MSSTSPPRAPPVKYNAPLGTRWEKEKAAAGGSAAFDLPSDPKNIGPWIIGECVGKGASGRVKIAKHKVTGELAAVKILPLAPLVNSRASLATQKAKSEKQRLGIDREITMMKLMNHPNILRIYDVYEGKKELFLVLEYVEGGELFDFLVNRGRLHAHEALTFFRQIVYGLNYAHTFSIIHRDLKPENILISSLSPPLIKIADWGMAAFAPPSLQLETSCGSPHYASPEIVNGERYQGNATDIWSCGVILFALLTGRLPFDDKNVKTLLNKVKSGKFDMPTWLDPLAQDLLGRMLVVDVNRRITIPEILSHPWLVVSSAANRCLLIDNPSLPPSPSILARPIPDASLIDKELFASLRIIWGRHADVNGDIIKKDLCAPAGRGVHAKAFYFLLGRYREETCKNDDSGQSTSSALSQAPDSLPSMSFNLDWELDTKIGGDLLKKYDVSTSPTVSPVSSPIPGRSQPIVAATPTLELVAPPMRRAVTTIARSRPASPGGPRQPGPPDRASKRASWQSQSQSQRPLPKSSFAMSGNARYVPKRGNTVAHLPVASAASDASPPIDLTVPPSQSSIRPCQADYERMSSRISDVAAPIIVAPIPLLPAFTPMVTQPAATMQADVLSQFAALGTFEQGRAHVRANTHRPMSSYHDKENQNQNQNAGDESWAHVQPEDGRSPEMSRRDAVKDMSSSLQSDKLMTPTKGLKERKNRPPPLDFPILNRKRSTFSIKNSPSPSAPSSVSAHNNRILASPVVGEFKGWFSNLFSWKHQGSSGSMPWVLYSVDDVAKTRFGLNRTLSKLGISVESVGEMMLKCRLDESPSGEMMNLKPVRFKVWLSPTTPSDSSQQLASPLLTPALLSAPLLPRGRTSTLLSKSPHGSPLPSPTLNPQAPLGCVTVIAVVHDKGSAATFRTIWRKLRDVYVDGSMGGECLSPPMHGAPVPETPRFAV